MVTSSEIKAVLQGNSIRRFACNGAIGGPTFAQRLLKLSAFVEVAIMGKSSGYFSLPKANGSVDKGMRLFYFTVTKPFTVLWFLNTMIVIPSRSTV